METTATYFSRFERTFVSPAGVTVYEYYDAESHTWVARVIARPNEAIAMRYVLTTESGHLWLIEEAVDEQDAVRQYETGDYEPWTRIAACDDDDQAEYLIEMGQAS